VDAKEESRRHFDRWSPRYEEDRVSRWLAEAQREALAGLELRPADRLLDVGCGTGAAVREAAPTVGRAVGVDLSAGMIDRARELGAGLDHAEFVRGDSENLPFGDGEFTAVLCTTSFHHYPQPDRALREMARVLAPGGRLAIADARADHPAVRILDVILRRVQRSHIGFRRFGELEALLEAAGLKDVGSRTMWSGGYMIVIARKPGSG
jgi:ubiquinone/menaquinone biosynthesis C-methylase UbiE